MTKPSKPTTIGKCPPTRHSQPLASPPGCHAALRQLSGSSSGCPQAALRLLLRLPLDSPLGCPQSAFRLPSDSPLGRLRLPPGCPMLSLLP
eukprot:361619-Chlamydomonas_euryale.AAC.4